MQLQGVAPESLAAKGVRAEDASAIVNHLSRMRVDRRVKSGTLPCLSLCSDLPLTPKESGSEQQNESQSFFHRKASPIVWARSGYQLREQESVTSVTLVPLRDRGEGKG